MKTLIIGQVGIGDTFTNTFPLAQVAKNGLLHGLFHNEASYRLARETPFFDACIPLPYLYTPTDNNAAAVVEVFQDAAKLFPQYDRVYLTSAWALDFMARAASPELLVNIVPWKETADGYRPIRQLEKFGFEFHQHLLDVDINWYAKFYRDFKCSNRSVLFEPSSYERVRNYRWADYVVELLEHEGFEIHRFDYNLDIRTNMHLVHQVRHVLTTDTAAVWMARALGKEPHIFIAGGQGKFHLRQQVLRINCRNIVPWYDNINEIPPEEIVEGFLRGLKSQFLI